MAAYTTYAKVILLLDTDTVEKLTDDAEAGTYASGVVNECIAWAGNRIDAYAGAKYSVPFAAITATPATPELISDIAVDLTVYRLYARRGWRIPQMLSDTYLLTLEQLKQIANGTMTVQDGTVTRGTAEVQILGTAISDDGELDFSGEDNFQGFTSL
uniref:Uncharacterized protein n=1 Tax=viral metagenome TaxID=1070528 RepID=A0A6H1ZRD1_9ZZZZ